MVVTPFVTLLNDLIRGFDHSDKVTVKFLKLVQLVKSIVATGAYTVIIFPATFTGQWDLNKDATMARWS